MALVITNKIFPSITITQWRWLVRKEQGLQQRGCMSDRVLSSRPRSMTEWAWWPKIHPPLCKILRITSVQNSCANLWPMSKCELMLKPREDRALRRPTLLSSLRLLATWRVRKRPKKWLALSNRIKPLKERSLVVTTELSMSCKDATTLSVMSLSHNPRFRQRPQSVKQRSIRKQARSMTSRLHLTRDVLTLNSLPLRSRMEGLFKISMTMSKLLSKCILKTRWQDQPLQPKAKARKRREDKVPAKRSMLAIPWTWEWLSTQSMKKMALLMLSKKVSGWDHQLLPRQRKAKRVKVLPKSPDNMPILPHTMFASQSTSAKKDKLGHEPHCVVMSKSVSSQTCKLPSVRMETCSTTRTLRTRLRMFRLSSRPCSTKRAHLPLVLV